MILVIQLIRSSGVKAVKGLCAPFVITKFIVSVYLNFTNSNVQTNFKIELLSPVSSISNDLLNLKNQNYDEKI